MADPIALTPGKGELEWLEELERGYLNDQMCWARDRSRWMRELAASASTTPIEHRLLATLMFFLAAYEQVDDYDWGFYSPSDPAGMTSDRLKSMAQVGFEHGDRKARCYLSLTTQCCIGRYRADIAIAVHGQGNKRLFVVVECDGHDFHERTKEQAQHDKSRDRAFQMLGFVVLRFTGSEIFQAAHSCANQIIDLITERMSEGDSNG